MRIRRTTASALVMLLAACTGPGEPRGAAPSPTTSPTAVPSSVAPASPTVSPTASPSPAYPRPSGPGPRWPVARREAPPPALGAVETQRIARVAGGGTLAAKLVLPRVGGTASAPVVLTPCGRRATLSARDLVVIPPSRGGALPKRAADVLVVVDPGHGGQQLGARAPNGDVEKARNLEISREVRRALAGRVGRVVLTRDRDMEATIGFRAALADALRADVAISVHLNSVPDGRLPMPGTETYGSVADPSGRRLAGVLYDAIRDYVDTLPGPFVGDRDAGAKYRVGRGGDDYYGLLRRAHRPWVITESLFISSAHEAALVARPDVRRGLGAAIAAGVLAFTTTREPGSGWVTPYPRPADPAGPPGPRCVDPAR